MNKMIIRYCLTHLLSTLLVLGESTYNNIKLHTSVPHVYICAPMHLDNTIRRNKICGSGTTHNPLHAYIDDGSSEGDDLFLMSTTHVKLMTNLQGCDYRLQ